MKDKLKEFVDWDIAAYELGCAIGIFKPDSFIDVKWIFWTDCKLGNGLQEALCKLVDAGVLEYIDGQAKYRWVFDESELNVGNLQ